jgi:hypothetical protein
MKHIKQVILRNLLSPASPYARVPLDMTYYSTAGDVIMGYEKKPKEGL